MYGFYGCIRAWRVPCHGVDWRPSIPGKFWRRRIGFEDEGEKHGPASYLGCIASHRHGAYSMTIEAINIYS